METTMVKGNSPQALLEFVRRVLLEVNTCIPGEVVAFDFMKQTATVKPCIRNTAIRNNGKKVYIDLPQIIETPVVFPYGTTEKFSLTYPVSAGDQCLLLFSQRSFDNWLLNGSVNDPVEKGKPRSHVYTDAICIPGMIPNTRAIQEFQKNGIEIRNGNRNSTVKVLNEKVRIHSGKSDITVDSTGTISLALQSANANSDNPPTGISSITILPSGDIKIDSTANVILTTAGNTTVTSQGNIEVTSANAITATAKAVSVNSESQINISAPKAQFSGDIGINNLYYKGQLIKEG